MDIDGLAHESRTPRSPLKQASLPIIHDDTATESIANLVVTDGIRISGEISAASIPLATGRLQWANPGLNGDLAVSIRFSARRVCSGQIDELAEVA